eukprot:TRINITY_DN8843_c0_g1_i1.p1 TRINITY_DN8843_c0_g1~~TRINITY_DN8843_c0_g1_i1.p1  ORF type:complete len:367 (-),score=94.72 TRINITY_DN8843_c0_g1_i1:79-1179(-)
MTKRARESDKPMTIDDIFEQYVPKIQTTIERYLPRTFDEPSLKKLFGEARYAYDAESATGALLTPIWDLLDRGGKRWRPVLVSLIAENLGGKDDLVLPAAYLCEIVHNGTLAVDDIEDDSKMRRGKPCLHLIYNVDVAINAGNAMYFFPLAELRELNQRKLISAETLVRAYELYSEEMINLHLGQGLDIWWHSGKKNPNSQEYLQMCAYKTGVLARLSARLAALLSGGNEEIIKQVGNFAEAIGVAFQIQDDLLNIAGEEFASKIAVMGEDIHEGKRTLMVIHSLEKAPKEKSDRLLEILNMHTNDEKLIKEAIEIMKSTNSLDYAAGVAKEIIKKAWTDVEAVLPNNEARDKLRVFADYLVDRKI